MRVLIAANAVRMGGALHHLCGLLPALAEAAPQHQWLVVTNPAASAALPTLGGRIQAATYPTEHLSPLPRLLYEQRLLATYARTFEADVLLSFNSFAVLGALCPQVLIAANALYVCPDYWKRLSTVSWSQRVGERLRCSLLRRSLRRVSRVVVPSRWMADALHHRFRLPRERLSVIHHGINRVFFEGQAEARQRRDARERVLLAASKHGINKDFATLVRALSLLVKVGAWDIRVQLTGTPDESRHAQATADLVSSLGLEERVRFLGEVSQRELARLHRGADVFVFPSWCESFGLPQVEAAASGMPVVAPDLPVSRELLSDAARYYRPLDAGSLVEQLADLLEEPDNARALGRRAAERVRAYTWERAAEGMLAALEATVRVVGARAS